MSHLHVCPRPYLLCCFSRTRPSPAAAGRPPASAHRGTTRRRACRSGTEVPAGAGAAAGNDSVGFLGLGRRRCRSGPRLLLEDLAEPRRHLGLARCLFSPRIVAGGRRRCERQITKIYRRGLLVDAAAAVPAQQQLQQLVAAKVRHGTHSAPTQK
jgi:hypothetical protein